MLIKEVHSNEITVEVEELIFFIDGRLKENIPHYSFLLCSIISLFFKKRTRYEQLIDSGGEVFDVDGYLRSVVTWLDGSTYFLISVIFQKISYETIVTSHENIFIF